MVEGFDHFTVGCGAGSGGTAIRGVGGWVMMWDSEMVPPVSSTGGIISGFDISVFLLVRDGSRGAYSVTLGIGWDGAG